MRPLRTVLDGGLPILGMVLMVGAILMFRSISSQLAVVWVGILCVAAGVWQLAHRVLPSDRRFYALRRELEVFLEGCRQLNQAALALKVQETPEQQAAFDDLRQALHQSVEVIAEVAGKTQAELERESREEMALR